MRPSPSLVLLLAVTGAACQDLTHLPVGECDNGALEPGEDCDLFADPALGAGTRCTACRYVCADGAACPDGWGCGADGTCAHATGRFQEASDSPFDLNAAELAVAELDGDGHLDVAGFTPGGVITLVGDGGGALHPGAAYVLAEDRSGPGAIADLDGDGRADLLLPFSAGLIVLRGDGNRTLAPMVYAPYDATGADALWWVPLQARGIDPEDAVLSLRNGNGFFLAGVVPLPGTSPQIDSVAAAGPSLAALGTRLPVADADLTRDGDEFLLAFAGAAEVTVHGTAHFLDGRLFLRELGRLTVPGVDRGAMFADVDGDGAADILVSAGADQVFVAHGDAAGGFTAPTGSAAFDTLAATASAPAPAARRWPLAAADLDGDARADYVGCDGVYLAAGAAIVLAAVRQSSAPWTDATVADFNGDGRADVAAVAEARARVEFLLADGSGGFNAFAVDTAAPPFSIRAGDVDGDLVSDLAFVEPGVDGAADSISVVFGEASGGPSGPVSMGQLPGIERLELGHLRGPRSPFDGLADLVVVADADQSGSLSLGFLGGTSRRTMASPFALYRPGIGADIPLVAVAGRFLGRAADDATLDLVALAEFSSALALWLVPGREGARLSLAASTRQSASAVVGAAPFAPACAAFAAGDLDGDGIDEVVGVDRGEGCAGAPSRSPSLVVLSTDGGAFAAAVTPIELAAGPAEELSLTDLDGDGRRDLLVVGGGAVTVVWNRDGGFDVASPSSIAGTDAAVLNADADPAPELAVVSAGLITLVEIDDHALVGTVSAVPAAGRVAAADLDGDGLDDLLLLSAGRLSVHLGESHRQEAP